MAKYTFVGFPVQPDQTVGIPDEALIVGANFTVQNQWQIMCLMPVLEVPVPEMPAPEASTPEASTPDVSGSEEEDEAEGDDNEGDEADANIPSQS